LPLSSVTVPPVVTLLGYMLTPSSPNTRAAGNPVASSISVTTAPSSRVPSRESNT
jgi:hypothetical protein